MVSSAGCGVVGAAIRTGSMPAAIAASAQGAASIEGTSATSRLSAPGFGQLGAETLAAARDDDVGVGQDADRDVGMAGAEVGDHRQAIGGADPGLERLLGGLGDHRAVGDRVGEGNADLDHVAPALDQGVEQGGGARRGRDGRASGSRRTRFRSARGEALEHRGVAAHAAPRAISGPGPCPCRRAPTGRPRSPPRASPRRSAAPRPWHGRIRARG